MKKLVQMIIETSMINESQRVLILSNSLPKKIDSVSVKYLKGIYTKRLSILRETLPLDNDKKASVQYFLDCLNHYRGYKIKYCSFELPDRRISLFFDIAFTKVFLVLDDPKA